MFLLVYILFIYFLKNHITQQKCIIFPIKIHRKLKLDALPKHLEVSPCFAEKSFSFKQLLTSLRSIPCKILWSRCVPYYRRDNPQLWPWTL